MIETIEKITETDNKAEIEKSDGTISTQLGQLQNLSTSNIKSCSGNLIVQFHDDMWQFLIPSDRYTVELYCSLFRMRQENKNYKIKYQYISRFFLLPSPDENHMVFVIVLDRPIRHDQQLCQMLVWNISKEISVVELQLDPAVLHRVYKDKLYPVMKGSLCNVIAEIFKVITDKKVASSVIQQSHVMCSCKVKSEHDHTYNVYRYKGYLYPLEEELIFIHMPSILIRFEDIENIEFCNHESGGNLESDEGYDMFIKVRPAISGSSSVLVDGVKDYVFCKINQSHFLKLKEFLLGKKIVMLQKMVALKSSSEYRGISRTPSDVVVIQIPEENVQMTSLSQSNMPNKATLNSQSTKQTPIQKIQTNAAPVTDESWNIHSTQTDSMEDERSPLCDNKASVQSQAQSSDTLIPLNTHQLNDLSVKQSSTEKLFTQQKDIQGQNFYSHQSNEGYYQSENEPSKTSSVVQSNAQPANNLMVLNSEQLTNLTVEESSKEKRFTQLEGIHGENVLERRKRPRTYERISHDWNPGNIEVLNVFLTLDSLENILPSLEAKFLGENLWIFTVQQLDNLLNDDLTQSTTSDIALRAAVAKEEFENALIVEFGDQPTVTEVLGRWRHAIKEWNTLKTQKNIPPSKFPFSGPVSCLISPFLTHFLSSNQLHTVHDFLSIKKTEGSRYVIGLTRLRTQHGFQCKPMYSAKALISVEDRILHALSSIPNADCKTRSWMGGSLVSLPKSIHDFFLEFCKIFTDELFLSTKNSVLSQKLMEWRILKNLNPLKGSGLGAMISTWKSLIKETRFTNSRQCLSFESASESDSLRKHMTLQRQLSMSEFSSSTISCSELPVTSISAIPNSEFRSDQEERLDHLTPHLPSACVSHDNKLSSLESTSTKYNTQSSGYQSSSLRFKKHNNGLKSYPLCLVKQDSKRPQKIIPGIALLQTQVSYDDIEDFDSDDDNHKGATKSGPGIARYSNHDEKGSLSVKANDNKPSKKRRCPLLNTNHSLLSSRRNDNHNSDDLVDDNFSYESDAGKTAEQNRKRSQINEDERKLSPKKTERKSKASSPKDDSEYPLDGLSESVRDFLRNRVQITTGRELLSYKSTDLADEYEMWRREQNKPPLKGNGAYTTVYGWKSVVKEKRMKRRRIDSGSDSSVNPQNQSDDTLDCLSEYVRDFLRNRIQITTSHELLSYKSNELADEYERWRQEQNKPPLKGNGAYTTVCGWKSVVKENAHKRRRSDSSSDSHLINATSVSLEVSRKNTIMSDRDEFWKNMDLLSTPTRLTGLPFVQLTFHRTITANIDCCYYFTLWALENDDRVEYFMTYNGASAFIPTNDHFDEKTIFAKKSSIPTVLIDSPLFEKEMYLVENQRRKQYDLFHPFTRHCCCLELTRFNLFGDKKEFDDDLNELKSMINNYLDAPQELTCYRGDRNAWGHSSKLSMTEHPMIDKDNGDPILLRLRDSEGFERHILQYNFLVQRGQTVRLAHDCKESPSSLFQSVSLRSYTSDSIKQLVALGLRISTLSFNHIEALTSRLCKAFKLLKSRLDNALMAMRPGKYSFAHQASFKEIIAMFRQRRRFHVVCKKLLSQCKILSVNGPSSVDMDSIDQVVGLLTSTSWNDVVLRHGLWLHTLNDSMLLNELHDDIKNEIIASCIERGRNLMMTTESDFSSNLYHGIMNDVSHHVLFYTSDDKTSQKFLSEVIYQRAVAATRMLFEVCERLDSNSLRKIAFIPKQSTHSSTEATPIIVIKQNERNLHKSTMAPTYFSSGDEHFQDVGTITSVDTIIVHKDWYLMNHVLFPIHCICSCGIIPWLRDEDVIGKYNLQSLEWLYTSIMNSIGMARSNECLNLNSYNMLKANLPESKSATALDYPRWTHAFFQIIWPSLVRHGWIIHLGSTVDELRFVLYRKICVPHTLSIVDELTQQNKDISQRLSRIGILPRRLFDILEDSIVSSSAGGRLCLEPHRCSVKYALEKFASSKCFLSNKLPMSTFQLIVQVFEKLFDDMRVHLLFQHERLSVQNVKGYKLHDLYACDVLVRLLVVLPDAIKPYCSNPETERSIHLFIVGLIDFLNENHSSFFTHSVHPLDVLTPSELNLRGVELSVISSEKFPSCVNKPNSFDSSHIEKQNMNELDQYANYCDYKSLTISRLALSKICSEPYFEAFVCNLFVRINAGRDYVTQAPKYMLARINAVVVNENEAYEFLADPGKPPVKTHLYLSLSIGNDIINNGMNFVSDSPPLDHEIEEYLHNMNQQGIPWLHKDEVSRMREAQISRWNDSLHIMDDEAHASLSLYKAMTISRKRLFELCTLPIFEKAVLKFYVQVSTGENTAFTSPATRFCRILAVEVNEKEYYEIEILDQKEATVMTNKFLLLDDGSTTTLTSMDLVVSCESSLEEDIRSYISVLSSPQSRSRLLKKVEAFYLLQEYNNLVCEISEYDTKKETKKELFSCSKIISASSADISRSLEADSPLQADDILENRVEDFTIVTLHETNNDTTVGKCSAQHYNNNQFHIHTEENMFKARFTGAEIAGENEEVHVKDIHTEVDDHKEKVETNSPRNDAEAQIKNPISTVENEDDNEEFEEFFRSNNEESVSKQAISFSNYTDLLTYISSSPEWMSKPDVARQIQKYNLEVEKQGCIEMLQKYKQRYSP